MDEKMVKKIVVVSVISILVIGCGGERSENQNLEFNSSNSCLKGLKKHSNMTLRIITDTPGLVSGKLANGEPFVCQRATSGTKGVYFKGWYSIKKS
jgi:hypothetical protein